jgi:hypothetical protein
MKKRPIFHLFLTLTVLLILIGIVVVIFTQFDRGYVTVVRDNEITEKQYELIKQIAKAGSKTSVNQTKVKNDAKSNNSVLNLIDQVKQDDNASDHGGDDSLLTDTDREIARINNLNHQSYVQQHPATPYPYSRNSYGNYQQYWLSNNPWSPDYNPNNRY